MKRLCLAVVASCFLGSGCDTLEITTFGGYTMPDKDCSGLHADNGCDDCNPCTDDIWCDISDTRPFKPAVCALLTESECRHVNLTTPDGVKNSCFPVAGSSPATMGICCEGVCIDATMCMPS